MSNQNKKTITAKYATNLAPYVKKVRVSVNKSKNEKEFSFANNFVESLSCNNSARPTSINSSPKLDIKMSRKEMMNH